MNCPSFDTLSAFVDHELEPAEARAIEAHLATCDRCREELLDWVDDERRLVALDCVEPEILVAFSDGVLSAAEQIAVNAHLATCPHCRGELDAMNAVAQPTLVAAAAAPVRESWGERAATALAGFGRMMIRPGPLLSAVTATALLIIALAQTAPREALHQLDTTASVTPVGESKTEIQRQQLQAPAPLAPRKDAGREEDAPAASLSASEAGGRRMPAEQAEKEEAAPAPAAPPPARLAAPEGEPAKRKAMSLDNATPSSGSDKPSTRGLTDQRAAGAANAVGGLADRAREPDAEARVAELFAARPTPLLSGRGAPKDDAAIIAHFQPEEVQRRLEERNGWTLVALTERRQVWIRSTELDAALPPVQTPTAGSAR